MSVDITILVATRNRKESIINFLKRMNKIGQYPSWELIVIDNGSSDGTSEYISKFNNSFPLVLLREKLAGKSRALNKGMLSANGKLLIFTDDDIIPDKDWIIAMYRASCLHKEKFIFGGRIKVDSNYLPAWVSASYNLRGILSSEHDFGDKSFIYPPGKYPLGPNMAVRKRLVDHNNGAWPVNLGPGTELPLGDERGFLASLCTEKEIERLYVADSIVWHVPEEEQLQFFHAVKRCYQCGIVQGRLDMMNKASGVDSALNGSLIVARLKTCRSIREFCCITIRALGVVIGRSLQG